MTIPKTLAPVSSQLSRFRPASIPSGMPTMRATNIAATVSSSVAAPFCAITCVTGRWSVRVVPRFPVRTCFKYSPYWTMSGLS